LFSTVSKVIAALAIVAAAASPAIAHGKAKVYGDGLTLKKATPIDSLFATPAKFVGKTVRVDGVASSVCENAGCWIDISDAKSGKAIRFKVEDGVIAFPVTAKGHKASAEGTFEKLAATPADLKEHAKEHAEADAHEQCEVGSYLIRATGALIY
jgi:hypothetical protein